ncbi:MAG: S8 family serine peptidase, partial [Candidatus Krumholzibacteriota bacterium]
MSKSILVILALAVLGANPSFAGEIAPGLEAQLAGMADTDELKVLVVLKDQVDVAAMDRNLHMAKTTRVERHRMVVSSLRDQAAATQGDLLASLSAKSTKGVRGYRSHWLINGVVVTAEVGTIRELALRPDVGRVEPAARIELIEPVETTLDDKNADPPSRYVPDGIGSIRSHEVWYSLGIDGTGTIVGGLDTGVDLLHPALTDKWLARRPDVTAAEAWFIPGEFGDPKGPSDEHGHGTHTMGTMCGVTATDTVGVAPGAEWIASNAVYNYEDVFDIGIIAAMEFFADPDGDSGTTDDVPDVVNNSWGQITPDPAAGYLECDSIYWDAIDNCEAAGVVMIFAAGNEGPTAGSLRMPADRATTATNCFAVGSVYPTPPFLTSFFSSRGPSACGGPHEIKPEVMAPGNGIYSTWPGGGYAYLSGTSMAAPHVSGVVALMRQANPNADVTTIKETLMATAIDIRDIGEDNESGWGLIDAYEAVLAIMPHTGTVSGVITDGSTGLPCEGVMVARVGGLETFTTGPDGAYSFFLPSGVQEFTAKIFGYDDGLISVTILDDLTVNGDLTLNLQPVATVSGTVYDPDGLPLEGAQVEAMETPAAPVSTDAAGYYELVLPIDPGNPYLVRATASGLGFLFQDVSLAGNTTVDFILPPDTTEDFESNHLYDYPWYQTDDTGWHLFWHTTTGAWEGSYCVRSAVTPNSNSSGLAIDYDVAEAGNISFRFRVNTEEFYDLFNFYVDDVVVGTWSGETDWAEFVHAVSAGPHTFKWEYTKDGSYFPVNDGAWVDFITFPLEAVPPGPTVSVSTSNITTILQPDATASVPVTVFNTGAVGLEFNAKVLKVDPAKAAGVDPFGYVWKDSDEPDGPAYDWIDISADGVDAGVADDALLGPFALGFTMPFYGADYDSVWIGTNGFLSFTGDSHDYRNGLIPDAAVPNGHLAFFWDDMRSNQGGT